MIVDGNTSYSFDRSKYEVGKRLKSIGKRLEGSLLVHISYQNIYTRFNGLHSGEDCIPKQLE